MGFTKKAISVGLSATMLATLLATAFAGSAFASATVTAATGGTAISADTVATGAYTALTGPSVAVGAANDIVAGNLVFTAPAGFQFDATGLPAPSYTAGASGVVMSFVAATATQIQYNVSTAATGAGTVTFTNWRVRPIAGTSLATGNITLTTGTIVGVASGANFGTLTEVAGALSISHSTFTGPSAAVATGAPGATLTATLRDQFGNPVTAGDTITISQTGGTVFTTLTGASGATNPLVATATASAAGTAIFTAVDTTASLTFPNTVTVTYSTTAPTPSPLSYGTNVPYSANLSTQVANGTSYIDLSFSNSLVTPSSLSITVTGGYFLNGTNATFVGLTYPRTSISLTSAGVAAGHLYLASSTAGTAVVTVSYYTASTNTTVTDSMATFTFTAATSTTVSTSYSSNTTQPSSISASPSGDTLKNIVTTVRDTNNGAISVGATVTWTLSPLGYFAGGSNTASTSVNSLGVFTSPDIFSTGAVGATTLTTSISYLGVTYTLPNATITFVGSPAKIVLSNTAYSLTTAGTSDGNALVAVVTDAAGNKITSGLTFAVGAYTPANIFTVTPGAYVSADGGWDIAAACNTSLAAGGTATVTITQTTGTTTITSNAATLVCADTLSATTLGTFTISAASPTVAPNGTDAISVSVKDDNGLPAPDGTSVTAVTNGVGNVVSSSGGLTATTSNGVAKFTYLAPANAGSGTVTAFVGNTTTGSAAVTLTIGTAAPAVSYTAASALGVTTSGPFSTATKLPKIGKYVTVKFSFGAANAGKTVIIDVATKTSGVWSAFKGLTTRVANSNGDVFFYWKSSSASWLSIYGDLGGAHSNSVQARWM